MRPRRRTAPLPPVPALVVLALATSFSVTVRADDGGDEWFGSDKVLHFGLSAGIAATTYTATTPLFDARYPPLLIGAAATLAIGGAKEAYDSVSGGDPSWKDFTWDAIGTVAGLAIGYALDLALRGVGPDHPWLGAPAHKAWGPSPTTVRLGRGLVVSF
jgi:putative lipoprotein